VNIRRMCGMLLRAVYILCNPYPYASASVNKISQHG
jgi:hypothetical protein